MPIYEYTCKACGAETEVMQRLSDAPAKDCPVCGKKKSLVKSMSAPGFRLSGGGWYETDFKSGKKKNLAGEGAEAKGKSETKSDAASKPAATEKAAAPAKSEPKPKPKPKSESAATT